MTFVLTSPPEVLDVPPYPAAPEPCVDRLPHPLGLDDGDAPDIGDGFSDEWDEDGDCFDGSDCGRFHDGTCSLAGTEYCDWDCPYS